MNIKGVFDKIFRMTMISSILCLLFGILGLFNTSTMIETIAIFMGSILLFVGLFIIFKYFVDDFVKSLLGYSLLYGLLDILTGILLLVNPSLLILIISIFIVGNLLIEFVTKLQFAFLLKKYNIKGWIIEIILALILLICIIIIIFNPVIAGEFVTKLVSISIIISSLINIVDCILVRKKVKNLNKSLIDLFN